MSAHHRNSALGLATRAIHHGYDPAEHRHALSAPVYLTSTYSFASVEDNEMAASHGGVLYAREHNPTTEILEARLADLEGAQACVAVASGMAAFGSLTLSLLSQGDEIVTHRTLYSNTMAMIGEGLPRFGITVIPADLRDPSAIDTVLTPRTRIVYIETPVNPTSDVLDIAAIAAKAHRAGAFLVVDGTFASPVLQRPLELGADLVLHSLTKYINGHGDALGGAVLGSREIIDKIHSTGLRYITGATLSPMASALILRGLKTLPLRMQRHSASALEIAQYLQSHPAVAWVKYPFLPSHPARHTAARQMSAGSGMLSFGLTSGFEGARRLMNGISLISRAVSLGDIETLIMHPASLKRARKDIRPEGRLAPDVGEDLIRLSVGLEDTKDLIDDLGRGLSKA
jgi:methionine-gamma-lyase